MMKNLLTLFLIVSTTVAFSQVSYMDVKIDRTKRGDVVVSAAVLTLSHGNKKDAYKAFSKDLKKASKDKIMGNWQSGDFTLTNANWKELNQPFPVQVLANFREGASGLELQVVLADTNNAYIELNDTEIGLQIVKYLTRFGHQQHLNYLEERLKTEEKVAKSIKSEVKDAQGDAKNAERKIVKNKNKIENLKEDIQIKKAEQERLIAEITSVDRRIAATNPADADLLKAVQKEKEALEKSLKKSRKAVEDYREDIFDLESDIVSQQNDIKSYQVNEQTASSKLAAQQAILDDIQRQIQETAAALRAK